METLFNGTLSKAGVYDYQNSRILRTIEWCKNRTQFRMSESSFDHHVLTEPGNINLCLNHCTFAKTILTTNCARYTKSILANLCVEILRGTIFSELTKLFDKVKRLALNHGEIIALIARFMGPTWGPSWAERTLLGPMLAPWTLLSGWIKYRSSKIVIKYFVRLVSNISDRRPHDCLFNHLSRLIA